MTLVLSVHGRDSLWVLVDRRLSYADGRLPIDDAMKVMHLETDDGTGLLAYAGLGATPRGTQPSEWMSAVLRGRGGLTFEGALGALSDAANRELPKHLAGSAALTSSSSRPSFDVLASACTASRTCWMFRQGSPGTASRAGSPRSQDVLSVSLWRDLAASISYAKILRGSEPY